MKFFSGTRGPKKRTSADLIKMVTDVGKSLGKAPAQSEYKKLFEEKYNKRMEKMREDYMSGKNSTYKMPGTKSDSKPKEMSTKAKQMLEMMAMRKATKDLKKQRRQETQHNSKLKSEKTAAENAKWYEEQRLKMLQQSADDLIQQQLLEAKRRSEEEGW